MTRNDALRTYFDKLIGIELSDKELQEIIEITHKKDTDESNVPVKYLDSTIIIRDALREAGYDAGLFNAFELWHKYSHKICTSWIGIPKDGNGLPDKVQIVDILKTWFDIDKTFFRL